MPRTILRHANCRRRVPAWTSVALVLLLASATPSPSSTKKGFVEAFVLPQQRVRVQRMPSTMAVRSAAEDKKQASLEFGDDEAEEKMKKKHNGKELRNGKKPPPGSPLSMLCEEAEVEDPFEIHVGRALDTLKKNYPHMLTEQPDFDIYDKNLEVIDPSGVTLHGLKNYKSAFRLMHAIVHVFYCPERSGLTFRMCYDTARQSIRVSWNAEVIPKAIFGGVRTTLHVDGISVYEISRSSGMITQHRIERLVVNDSPVKPQQGIWALLRNEHDESVPVFNSFPSSLFSTDDSRPTTSYGSALEFRQQEKSIFFDDDNNNNDESLTALSAVEGSDASSDGPSNGNQDYPGLDWEAYERKNASRKKFGLDPLTPEEFLENEAVVSQMESQQRQRAASASAAAEMTKQGNNRQQGLLERLFGDIVPDACESNYDCERPEICCDFGFKKICCASGTMVGNKKLEPAFVPVPADIYPPGQEPQTF